MTTDGFSREDQVPEDYLVCSYPLDGYEALGQVIHDATVAVRRRLRHARRRRRELRLLRATFALPAFDAATRRPAG